MEFPAKYVQQDPERELIRKIWFNNRLFILSASKI